MNTDAKRFKELKYTGASQWNDKKRMRVSMCIPGVNSGMYSKELSIHVTISEPKNWGGNRLTHCEMRLNVKDIEELRDECNKILDLNK